MDDASASKSHCPAVTTYNEHESKQLLSIISLPDLSPGTKNLQPHYSQVQHTGSLHPIHQKQFSQEHVHQELLQKSNVTQQIDPSHHQQHKVNYQQYFDTHGLKEEDQLEKGQNCALEIFTSISQHVNNAAVDFNVAGKDAIDTKTQDAQSFQYDIEYTSTGKNRLGENVCESGMPPPENVPNFQVPLSASNTCRSQILDQMCLQNFTYMDENKKGSQLNVSIDMLTAGHSESTGDYHDVYNKADTKVTTVKESSKPFSNSNDIGKNHTERVNNDSLHNQIIESPVEKQDHIQKEVNVKDDFGQPDNETNGGNSVKTVSSDKEYMENDYKCLCKDDFMTHAQNKVKKYICGCCCSKFISICLLHHHLELHGSGGSYHFDHVSHTAFPKYDTFCSFTQTENIDHDIDARLDESDITEDINNSDESIVSKTTIESTDDVLLNKSETLEHKTSAPQRNRRKQVNPKPIKLTFSHHNKGDRVRKSKRKLPRKDMVKSDEDIVKEGFHDNLDVPSTTRKVDDRENEKVEKKLIIVIENKNTNESEGAGVIKPFKKRGRPRKSESLNDTRLVKKKRTIKRDKEIGSLDVKPGDEINNSQENNESEVTSIDTDELKEIVTKVKIDDSVDAKVDSHSEVKPKVRKNASKFEMCDVCGLPVPKYNYIYHMRRHTGEKPYVCDKCGKAFAHRRFLVKHMLIHVEDKPWKCELCSAQFCQKTEYSMHMNAHQGNRPHECKVCEMKFLSKGMLNTHQANVHMGITRFECEVCNRRFFKRSSLNVHQATHYEATMKCHYCDRMFKDKAGLKRHECIHTGEKRFRCHICNHEFIQSTPYWVHMEKRHKMDRESVKNMLKDIRESNKRYGIRTEINVLPKDVDHLLVTQENNDTNKSKTIKPTKKNVSEKLQGVVKSPHNVDMIGSYNSSAPFQQLKNNTDNTINVQHQKPYTSIKVPNLNTCSSNVSVMAASNTYSSMDNVNAEPFSLQPHFRYIDSSQEPVIVQTTDCGPGSASLQEVTSASSQSLGLPANIPVPVSIPSLGLPMNPLGHGFIGLNPLQQALDFSSSLPPHTGSYTDISQQQ